MWGDPNALMKTLIMCDILLSTGGVFFNFVCVFVCLCVSGHFWMSIQAHMGYLGYVWYVVILNFGVFSGFLENFVFLWMQF